MKSDTQHLEFLISQYVDGTLDAASRKSIEQQLLTDPVARQLYQQHQETQDVLDDFGSRLPMINWSEFEATLGERIERETSAARPKFFSKDWKKWIKPAAVAAALMFAAGIGYFMRAMEVPASHETIVEMAAKDAGPSRDVAFDIPKASRVAGVATVDYTGNLPAIAKTPPKVEVGEDPLMAIEMVRKEGAMNNWSIGRDPASASAWLPQTQPGAVEASQVKSHVETENGIQ